MKRTKREGGRELAEPVVLNSIHLEGQGRQPPAVTAQPPTAQSLAARHQLFAATAASCLHT